MADIRMLIVADGPYLQNTPAGGGISFAPSQDLTDNVFTITEFIYLLKLSQAPTISIDTAHRRQDRDTSTTPPTVYPTFENFNFATTTNLDNYDVIWLFAYEGWNDGLNAHASPITPAEIAAINAFMDTGGGVFATGDHYGMGSLMCGQIPRVQTMRKWWGRTADQPAGYPAQVLDWSGATVTSVNRPAFSTQSTTNPPYPADPNDPSMNRADTTQMNPETGGPAPDTANVFQFDDQSDNIPQILSFPGSAVHPILEGSTGPLTQYPDHMHEGEVVAPFMPDGTEYPSEGGYQPLPSVIATGAIVPNHITMVDGASCEQSNFSQDSTYTAGGTNGILCAYDGRGAGKGRIVTDSSWHHFLDINLIGDPCGSTLDRRQGFGLAKMPPASGSVLTELQAIYVNTVAWLARQNPNFYFVVDKSTYGYDESETGATFAAFWLVIEGYTLSQVQAAVSAGAPQFAGAFAALNAISPPGTLIAEGGPNSQRILIPYTVKFPASVLNAFPMPGHPAEQKLLIARFSVTVSGNTNSYAAETSMELTAGADPYFQNVNPSANNPFYLSQDLCVFTLNPQQSTTIPSVPNAAFPQTNTTVRNTSAANTFITQVLNSMNNNVQFTNPGTANPFANFPSVIDGTGDSSVTGEETINSNQYVNYNFAIARVRLQGAPGVTTNPKTARVFFRLFLTQTNDTDFQPNTTYLSQLDTTTGLPRAPQPDPDGSSQPFFATGGVMGDYLTTVGPVNNFALTVGPSGDTSAYFGCHLDVFDPANNAKYPGTHHCIVAQIAYDDDPIINANGITLGPENCDKLAQRNLQITKSGNPGGPDAHRIPQTFDTRPSAPTGMSLNELQGYPDELMIQWGNVPLGSTATIYWPATDALAIVRLSMRLHSTDQLTLVDPHTIKCTVNSAVSYVPIPFGTGAKFAGLFTIDLPVGVRAGQEFDVLVRRISTRKSDNRNAPAQATIEAALSTQRAAVHHSTPAATKSEHTSREWRYVVGTFQVKIPVAKDDILLLPEENTLAIMKWRLLQTPPGSRWYPVLTRYIAYLSGRVNAFGGNAGSVLPSPTGVPVPAGGGGKGSHGEEFMGKVESITYDRFGDFEGFHLLTEAGHRREFRSHEPEIEHLVRFAWTDRVVISVLIHHHHPERPVSIVLRRPPIL
ncbi:hypothetical protein LT85_0754 [Collimonas arenae]|uniref:Uncharacterized protein n=1 Tax=Collimonas arenae TaxID=279058 RepID=A0A0A1F8C0_9BURK|nr:hypothetical protein [Collimonas arenae]AIY39914.1 hypothetical protein LT85_0754 [Collimonas arenae]